MTSRAVAGQGSVLMDRPSTSEGPSRLHPHCWRRVDDPAAGAASPARVRPGSSGAGSGIGGSRPDHFPSKPGWEQYLDGLGHPPSAAAGEQQPQQQQQEGSDAQAAALSGAARAALQALEGADGEYRPSPEPEEPPPSTGDLVESVLSQLGMAHVLPDLEAEELVPETLAELDRCLGDERSLTSQIGMGLDAEHAAAVVETLRRAQAANRRSQADLDRPTVPAGHFSWISPRHKAIATVRGKPPRHAAFTKAQHHQPHKLQRNAHARNIASKDDLAAQRRQMVREFSEKQRGGREIAALDWRVAKRAKQKKYAPPPPAAKLAAAAESPRIAELAAAIPAHHQHGYMERLQPGWWDCKASGPGAANPPQCADLVYALSFTKAAYRPEPETGGGLAASSGSRWSTMYESRLLMGSTGDSSSLGTGTGPREAGARPSTSDSAPAAYGRTSPRKSAAWAAVGQWPSTDGLGSSSRQRSRSTSSSTTTTSLAARRQRLAELAEPTKPPPRPPLRGFDRVYNPMSKAGKPIVAAGAVGGRWESPMATLAAAC
eukprot:SAG22_NODE_70_length_22717_cov_12.413741_6_plen_546_part_00